MSGDFNPYHQWCGLAEDATLPDHYALLGLKRFEADQMVIQRKYAELYSRVRKFQQGRRREDAMQLLDEISEAFATLADDEGKRQYDRFLRDKAAGRIDEEGNRVARRSMGKPADNSNLRELLRAMQEFDSLAAFTFYDILGVAPSETRPQSLFNFYSRRNKLLAQYYGDHLQRFKLVEAMQEALRWLSDTRRRQVYTELYQQFPRATGDELLRRAKKRLNLSEENASNAKPASSTPPRIQFEGDAAETSAAARKPALSAKEIFAIVVCAITAVTVLVVLWRTL